MSISFQEGSIKFLEGPESGVRTVPVIGIIDTSGSMSGAKIGMANAALRNLFPELVKLDESTADVSILIQLIAFDDSARLIFPEPTPASQVTYVPLECGVKSNLGAGLNLAREQFEKIAAGGGSFRKATMFVVSDGAVHDWEVPLEELLNVQMAARAQRLAFAVGDDADRNMLSHVVSSDQDGVCDVDGAADLYKKLLMGTLGAVENASRGRSTDLRGTSMELPEIDGSLLPPDVLETPEDVAKKLNLDPKELY